MSIHDEAAAMAAVLDSVQPVGPGVPVGFGDAVAADIARRHTRPVVPERPARVAVPPGATAEPIPGMVVRPGDVLLLTAPQMTPAHAETIKAEVMARMPDLADVVVIAGGHVAGVYRREEAP